MNISSAFPSRYLRSADIPPGSSTAVTINTVKVENVENSSDPDDDKPVLYFEDRRKGMVLNRTNAAVIAEAYGDETDDWKGQPVEVFVSRTEFRGRSVPCLRLRIPDRTQSGAVRVDDDAGGAPPAAPETADASDIPF